MPPLRALEKLVFCLTRRSRNQSGLNRQARPKAALNLAGGPNVKRAADGRPFWLFMANRQKPLIWIIDNNHWERANIRAVLIERGFEVDGFVSIFHAVVMLYREIVERPAAIVLEIRNLPFQSTELYELIRIGTPVILLTGVYEGRELVDEHNWAEVLRRPFTIGQIVRAVERLVGRMPL